MTALDGIRVIEIAHERISFAGKLLGDMGADVILVEPPDVVVRQPEHVNLGEEHGHVADGVVHQRRQSKGR